VVLDELLTLHQVVSELFFQLLKPELLKLRTESIDNLGYVNNGLNIEGSCRQEVRLRLKMNIVWDA
jgi:hypothetical protein